MRLVLVAIIRGGWSSSGAIMSLELVGPGGFDQAYFSGALKRLKDVLRSALLH